jgi:hypothetical protein
VPGYRTPAGTGTGMSFATWRRSRGFPKPTAHWSMQTIAP